MFDATSLRSRVARRIFGLFLICAFLPFGGLVLVSYYQVASFFDQKNQNQLRALAKVVGMDVFEKLTLLESELLIIASGVKGSAELASDAGLKNVRSNAKEQWNAVWVIRSDGRRESVFGQMDRVPVLSASDRQRLESGKALLSVVPGSSNAASRIFLSVSIEPRRSESDILTGEINSSYVWGIVSSRLLRSYIDACVQDQSGVMLMCSDHTSAGLPNPLKEKIARSALGDFEWTEQGKQYLASYWTVPLKFEFQDPGWTVILKTSKEGAFASIAELRRTFILAIVVSAGLSILLALSQLRKRLVPVEKLQEGTRRIAQQDFGFQVNVRSNDEFEDLAESVNTMARHLGRQFNTLATKAEIERAVLSLLDTEKIVETILTRLLQIFPCDGASLTLLNSDQKELNQIFILHRAAVVNPDERSLSGALVRAEIPKEKDAMAARAVEAKIPIILEELESRDLDFEFFRRNDFRSMMMAPLMVKDDVLAVLAFYSVEQQRFDEKEVSFVRALTSQAAIAIYNSQLFERIKRQAIELERANRAKDEFLSVMSHELRTPLNVILGYLHMIQEKLLGDLNVEQTRAVQIVERHSNDLFGMIDSIMEATKIEAGAVVLENQYIDPVKLLEALEAQYAVPTGKELIIAWHFSRDLPALHTDESKLRRILQNLIGNAIKFTGRGRVDISASYNRDGQVLEFSVADTGVGMSEESHAAIFEMFRQLDSSRTREYGGLGLGLYIAKKLSTLLGASITVNSRPGRGATFTLTLPVTMETTAKRVA